jgi:hypothetical protein
MGVRLKVNLKRCYLIMIWFKVFSSLGILLYRNPSFGSFFFKVFTLVPLTNLSKFIYLLFLGLIELEDDDKV